MKTSMRLHPIKDGPSRVATTEIEADCQSSDGAAHVAPRRRSERRSGTLDQ
jgi:hypothetical protein